MSCCLPSSLCGCHQCNQGTGGYRRLIGWEGVEGKGSTQGGGELIWPCKLRCSISSQQGCHSSYRNSLSQASQSHFQSGHAWEAITIFIELPSPRAHAWEGKKDLSIIPAVLLSLAVRLSGEEGGPHPSIRRVERIRLQNLAREKVHTGLLLASSNWLGWASVAILASVNPEKRSMVDRQLGRALLGS